MKGQSPHEMPIDGTLDLHTFNPSEAGELVQAYISECIKRGIYSIRIIHGKGKGILRRTVHSTLDRTPEVAGYRTAGEDGGGWGATLVDLKRY